MNECEVLYSEMCQCDCVYQRTDSGLLFVCFL
jgi:hypothetical protein